MYYSLKRTHTYFRQITSVNVHTNTLIKFFYYYNQALYLMKNIKKITGHSAQTFFQTLEGEEVCDLLLPLIPYIFKY